MVDQLTVFLENEEGRLAKLCRALADAGINMDALTLMDTPEYGVVRILCANPSAARDELNKRGYRASITKVSLIKLPDRPGSLADLLGILDDLDIPVEYGYCFQVAGDYAVDALKISDPAAASKATFAIEGAGFKVLSLEDLKSL